MQDFQGFLSGFGCFCVLVRRLFAALGRKSTKTDGLVDFSLSKEGSLNELI